ncbi:hypothetical protein C1I63_18530 [Rathayibacter caricis DSM 15933]|uniref:DUF2306 domain-containing protein n=1 Tax=Rathayibacter caricis DSM 15933 TaxID=1328867 RepID=A0A2T4UNZ2_9MICO|nr:hypothetical protein [Rathayibacter caricis]PTL71237.1 hypothetical protein C1I63_18530 [Rathayibacter caricis DSM 15933]
MYALSIAVHATAGVVGFALGLVMALQPRLATKRAVLLLYVAAMIVLVIGLAVAVVAEWSQMEDARRAVDVGLILLGLYTLLRAIQAAAAVRAAHPGWQVAFVDHVGFTLISLFDGFVIVAAINLGVPMPVVILLAILGVGGGIATMNRLRTRVD